MQAVHMGGGGMSPAVAAHLHNQEAPSPSCRPGLRGTVGLGGGGGAPQVRKHAHRQMGSGIISPSMLRHLSQFGGGLIHPAVVRHVKG